ncbi:MAG TPA: hypothetical protein VM099_05600 [Gemmatimonadaceae bacterium]|nr:hypothetical protein [Gemmatimonadaceae bacterium]
MDNGITDHYVEFDGQQIVIRSDDADIIDFVSRTYEHMLVPRATSIVAVLDTRRNNADYFLQSQDDTDNASDLVSISRYLRREIQQRFIGARSDLLWIHAGAVVRNNKCLLIPAPTAHGKSSLVIELCQTGWCMLSDDLAPVRINTLEVLPYPERPVRRLYPGRDVSREELTAIGRESVPISPGAICHSPAIIGGVVFPRFRSDKNAELIRLSPGETALQLVGNCTNFADHNGVAVSAAGTIAGSVPGHRLIYGKLSDAVLLLDGLGRMT